MEKVILKQFRLDYAVTIYYMVLVVTNYFFRQTKERDKVKGKRVIKEIG